MTFKVTGTGAAEQTAYDFLFRSFTAPCSIDPGVPTIYMTRGN